MTHINAYKAELAEAILAAQGALADIETKINRVIVKLEASPAVVTPVTATPQTPPKDVATPDKEAKATPTPSVK